MLLKTDDEFLNRISFVIMLDYFVTDDYYKKIFSLIENYKTDKYYAKMGLSWLLSELFIKYPEYTKEYLILHKLDDQILKFTTRKIKDSYRVSKKDKEWLKNIGN